MSQHPENDPIKAKVPQQESLEELNLENPNQSEEYSIKKLHDAILREKEIPEDGKEQLPLWLMGVFAALIFWAGAYVFQYSGGFNANVYNEEEVHYGPIKGGDQKKTIDPVAIGKRLYITNCASCHQPTGAGAAGQYPPLAGSEYVLSKAPYGENHLIRVMLNGLGGNVHVAGATYNGNMPAWSTNLKDDQIAYILTYIRQDWGNQAGGIPADAVAAIRKDLASRTNPWSEDELLKIPAEKIEAPSAPAAEKK